MLSPVTAALHLCLLLSLACGEVALRKLRRGYSLEDSSSNVSCAHGRIVEQVGCLCHSDVEQGFWEPMGLCDSCAKNYAGINCTIVCPGGSCNACSSHGVCNQGQLGDGTCRCFSDDVDGHWSGRECSDCQPGYFGAQCTMRCPQSKMGILCFGHGTCFSGFHGNGKCLCSPAWGTVSNCEDCDDSHFGPRCESVCPGTTLTGQPCNGHGYCFSGHAGNGTCSCDPSFVGTSCSLVCPFNCFGHGTCVSGFNDTQVCQCNQYWAPPYCESCVTNRAGQLCTILCTQTPYNMVCFNNGSCVEENGVPACRCVSGYASYQDSCDAACPGSPPCGGHGTCTANPQIFGSAACSSCSTGWAGPTCSVCDEWYANSEDCSRKCPGVLLPCSGHGTCLRGECFCSTGYCGRSCNDTTNCSACAYGLFGPSCNSSCPSNNGGVCNGNGVCTLLGDCRCYPGYLGSSCDIFCPIGTGGKICSGITHGTCNVTTRLCQCRDPFAGPACSEGCPMANGRACKGNGRCVSNSSGTAFCECHPGWTGRVCDVVCLCNADHGRCHPSCQDNPSFVTCSTCVCHDRFAGLCSECEAGLAGPQCDISCINGRTEGTLCRCQQFWSGAQCSIECPKNSSGSYCSRHGKCTTNGTCLCETKYAGAACEVYCDAPLTCQHLGKNSQCNLETGACECLRDSALGNWALGPEGTCNTNCAPGFWGPLCTETCNCNGRGSCSKFTGKCGCFDDDYRGHFSGPACTTCASGYIGAQCTEKNVLITRLQAVEGNSVASFTIPYAAVTVAAVDESTGRLFAGNSPMSVFNVSALSPVYVANESEQFTRLVPPSALFLCVAFSEEHLYAVTAFNDSIRALTFERRTMNYVTETTLARGIFPEAELIASATGAANSIVAAWTFGGTWQYAYLRVVPSCSTSNCSPGNSSDVTIQVNNSAVFVLPGGFVPSDIQLQAPTALRGPFTVIIAGTIPAPNGTMAWDALLFLVDDGASLDWPRPFTGGGNPSLRTLVPCWPSLDTEDIACRNCLNAVRALFVDAGVVLAISTANDTFILWARPLWAAQDRPEAFLKVDGACMYASADIVKRRSLACSNCSTEQWYTLVTKLQQPFSVPTALSMDTFSSVLYVALRSNASLSMIAKVRIDPLRFGVFGLKTLNLVQGQFSLIPEVVFVLAMAPQVSAMYSVASYVSSLTLGVFFTIDAVAISPSVADMRFGTVVTITGDGFRHPATCIFNGSVVDAVVLSSTVLECSPPSVSSVTTADACEGLSAEVSLTGGLYSTDSGLKLRRLQKPELSLLTPVKGTGLKASPVTVMGNNFVATAHGLCRFFREGQTPFVVNMSFLNPSTVVCVSHPVLQGEYRLDIALDGQQFSGSPLSFLVVGAATKIIVPQIPDVSASEVTTVSALIFTVDTLMNSLGDLDPAALSVCVSTNSTQSACEEADFSAWRFEGDPFPWPPCRSNNISFNTSASAAFCEAGLPGTGFVNFNRILIPSPRSGTFFLVFASEIYGSQSLSLRIVEGNPYALRISNLQQFSESSAPYAVSRATFLRPVRIIITDSQGNACSNIAFVILTAVASVQRRGASGGDWEFVSNSSADSEVNFVAKTVGGEFEVLQFSQMAAPFIHGVLYRVTFSAPGLQPCTTPAFETESCNPVEYKVINTGQCRRCENAGAICNGSSVVLLRPGHWRAQNASVDIYLCPVVDACLGESTSGTGATCFNGSTGPLCSLCKPGYGKTKTSLCQPCESIAATVAIFCLAVIAGFVIVLVWSFSTLRDKETKNITIVFRTIVNHMQTTGQLGEFSQQLTPFMRSLLNVQGGASSVNMSGFQTLACMLAYFNRSYVSVFVGYMCLPLAAPFVSVVLFAILRQLKLQPVLSDGLQQEIEDEIRAFGSSARIASLRVKYPFYFVFTTSVCVIIFTLYQTLIKQAGDVLKCVKVGPELSYLEVDMAIPCDKYGSSVLTTPGLLFAVVYGFGIPLGFVCAYIVFRGRLGKPELTNFVFMFLVGGYKQEFWYWQAVIMVRKLLLGMVTVFIPKELPELQNYLAMWIMMLALSLQLWLKPNTENMHNNVETFSLAAVTLTLNFGLVYFWPEVASGWQDFVTVFLITVTFFCLVVFAFYLYEPLRDELAKVETAVADVIRTMLEDKPDDPDPKRKRALLRRRAPEQPQDGAPLETIGFRPPLRARSFVSTNDFDEVDDNEEEDDRAIHPVQRGDFDEYY